MSDHDLEAHPSAVDIGVALEQEHDCCPHEVLNRGSVLV